MIFERPESDLNDVLYENDPEDDRPAKKEKAPRKALFGKKKAAEPEHEEPSEERPEPALAPAPPETNPVRAARRSRQEKYEQEYEEYKAQQRAAMKKKAPAAPVSQEAPAPRKAPAPQPQAAPADPYDAWVQASARAENRATSYADRVMDVPKARTPAPQPRPAAQTARPAPAAPAPAPAPKPQPVAPAPQPKPAAQNEEFNLDDILAEFK